MFDAVRIGLSWLISMLAGIIFPAKDIDISSRDFGIVGIEISPSADILLRIMLKTVAQLQVRSPRVVESFTGYVYNTYDKRGN